MHSGYLSLCYQLPVLVDRLEAYARKAEEKGEGSILDKVDSVLVTGVSGIVAGTLLANHYGWGITIVRREEELGKCHGQPVECLSKTTPKHFLVVDDLISLGDTLKRIKKGFDGYPRDATIEGVFLYQQEVLVTKGYSTDSLGPTIQDVMWADKEEGVKEVKAKHLGFFEDPTLEWLGGKYKEPLSKNDLGFLNGFK